MRYILKGQGEGEEEEGSNGGEQLMLRPGREAAARATTGAALGPVFSALLGFRLWEGVCVSLKTGITPLPRTA